MPVKLPLLILAAGAARRMQGRDKLLQTVDGAPLLARGIRIGAAAGLGPIWVTLPPAPHPRYAALAGLPATPVAVPDAADGLSASLRRGISALPADTQAVMILLADLPDLTADDLARVAGAVDLTGPTRVWRGASEQGQPGHPLVLRAGLFADVAALTGDTGARDLVAAAGDDVVHVPLPGRRAINDLDTPEAWARWRAANPSRA